MAYKSTNRNKPFWSPAHEPVKENSFAHSPYNIQPEKEQNRTPQTETYSREAYDLIVSRMFPSPNSTIQTKAAPQEQKETEKKLPTHPISKREFIHQHFIARFQANRSQKSAQNNADTENKTNNQEREKDVQVTNDQSLQTSLQKKEDDAYKSKQTKLLAQKYINKSSNTIQLAPIRHRSKKLRKTGKGFKWKAAELNATRRALRSLRRERKVNKKWTKKNIFTATVTEQNFSFTFHLQSAGLGGSHPYYKGKSASHTEQQWRGLVQSGLIKKYVNESLKEKKKKALAANKELTLESLFSSNEACNKNSSMPHGCGSIESKEMGLGATGNFYFANEYQTGGKKQNDSHYKIAQEYENILKENKEPKLRRKNSIDIFIDSDQLRGENIEKLDLKQFKDMADESDSESDL